MDELPPFELGYARTALRGTLVDAVLRGETVEDWGRPHERFWAEREIADDTLIVAERFRLVERGDAPAG